MPSYKLRHYKPYRAVNHIDHLLKNFSLYRKEFFKITRRVITYEEWYSLLESFNIEEYRERKTPFRIDDIAAIAKLFEEAHPYLDPHVKVPTLIMAIWAKYIGIVSDDELDATNSLWRKV